MAVGDQPAAAQKGGLPLWVILGGGAALGLFLYMRRKSSSSATQSPLIPATVTDPNTGLPVDPLTGLPYITNPQQAPTNESWFNGALQWASHNGISASLANSALYKYINGELLNANESNVIDKVLSGFGAPPSPLPFGGTPVLPKPTPGPTSNLPPIRGKFPEFISALQHKLVPVPAGSTLLGNVPLYGLTNSPYGPLYSSHQAPVDKMYNKTLYTLPEFAGYVQPKAAA